MLAGRQVPKVHNIFYLADLAELDYPDLVPLMDRVGELTGWGVTYRYPPLGEPLAPPQPAALNDMLASLNELLQAFAVRLAG